MKSLSLFNAVVQKDTEVKNPIILSEYGCVITPKAIWAKSQIETYLKSQKLDSVELNQTFHKSWAKVIDSTHGELMFERLLHYITCFLVDKPKYIYLTDENLEIENISGELLLINCYTKAELIDKCFAMLNSGIALQAETIKDLLNCLTEELGYVFNGKETFNNKEATAILATDFGVYPENEVEFLRCIIHQTIGNPLLIKNPKTINAIKESDFNPSKLFNNFGLTKLSTIFNRYKPLFLAYKGKCPKVINKIAKLSKKNHKPLMQNPLNLVTSRKIIKADLYWFENAPIFSLLRALIACNNRKNGQTNFIYRVRNGKSWSKNNESTKNRDICEYNYNVLINLIKTRVNLKELKVFIPKDVEYGIPTSEKMFIGNVPTGTIITDDCLSIGAFWKNEWGVTVLDLSGENENVKIGWDGQMKNEGSLVHSGDIVNAPNGAIEYIRATKDLKDVTIVKCNNWQGGDEYKFRLVLGKGDDVNKDAMMNPNNVFFQHECDSKQKEVTLGLLIPKKDKISFVLVNVSSGNIRTSSNNPISKITQKAILEQYANSLTLNALLIELGATLVEDVENANLDLTFAKLEKDSIMNIFKNK